MPKLTKNVREAVYQNGCVVAFNCSFWTGRKVITPTDLGLGEDELDKDIISLGSKYLISKELRNAPRNADAKARTVLLNYGIPFIVNGTYFVSYAHLERVIEKLEEIKEEFYSAAHDVIDSYESQIESLIKQYDPFIDSAFTNARARGYKSSQRTFRNTFVQNLLEAYPTKDYIQDQYRFDYVLFEIKAPDMNTSLNSVDPQALMMARAKYREEINDRIETFMDGIGDVVKAKVSEFVEVLQGKIDKKEIISQANTKKLTNLIEYVKAFRFAGNLEIEQQLENLSRELAKDGVARGVAKNVTVAKKVSTLLDTVNAEVKNTSDISQINGRPKRKFFIRR